MLYCLSVRFAAIASFLLALGFQVSGYTNVPLAIGLWSASGIFFVLWTKAHWGTPRARLSRASGATGTARAPDSPDLTIFKPQVRLVELRRRDGGVELFYYFSCWVRSDTPLAGIQAELRRVTPMVNHHLLPTHLRVTPRGTYEALIDVVRVGVNVLEHGPVQICSVDAPLELDQPPGIYSADQSRYIVGASADSMELTIRVDRGNETRTAVLLAEVTKRRFRLHKGMRSSSPNGSFQSWRAPASPTLAHDSSTNALIQRYRKQRGRQS